MEINGTLFSGLNNEHFAEPSVEKFYQAAETARSAAKATDQDFDIVFNANTGAIEIQMHDIYTADNLPAEYPYRFPVIDLNRFRSETEEPSPQNMLMWWYRAKRKFIYGE